MVRMGDLGLDEANELQVGEVQVWRLLGPAAEVAARCADVLSAGERTRAERLRVERARVEFVAGRVLLRGLLGAALGVEADEVELRVGAQGKPWVAGSVEFNVAHSRGVILVALCRGVRVGVDVEWVNGEVEALEIARGSFAVEEVRGLEAAAAGAARVREFYRVWTRKEAVLKMSGSGLLRALDSVTVGPEQEGEARVELGAGETAYVRGLTVEAGFTGALAVEDEGLAVRRLEVVGGALRDWLGC